jgi:hypothetical protein
MREIPTLFYSHAGSMIYLFITLINPTVPSACHAQNSKVLSPKLLPLAVDTGCLASIFYREIQKDPGKSVNYVFLSTSFLCKENLCIVHDIARDQKTASIWLNGFQDAEPIVSSIQGGASIEVLLDEGFIKTARSSTDRATDPGKITFKVDFNDFSIGCDPLQLQFDTHSSCWTSQCPSRQVLLTLRPALAENFFGHGLMHYVCKGDNNLTQVIGCVMGSLDDPRRLSIAAKPFRIPLELLSPERPETLKATAITDEHRQLIGDIADAEPIWAKEAWADANSLIEKQPQSIEEQAEIYVGLLSLTRGVNLAIDEVFTDAEAVVLEPVARGQYLHRLTWRPGRNLSIPSVLSSLSSEIVNREMRFALVSNLASMGICPEVRIIHFLEDYLQGEGDPPYRAAMAAHWHLPVKESEIEAVAELLKTAVLPSVRSEAIDVLVLLGQIDKIPADRMASWADANLLKAEPRLLRRKLAYLMKTKSGRDYLRGQMTSPAMSAKTRDVIKAVITKHVDATKKLTRFDMISEEEVAVLETTIRG